MTIETRSLKRLTEHLREEVGDGLQSVMHFDEGRFDVVYGKAGIENHYSRDELEDVVREIGVETLERPAKESHFDHGRLRYAVNGFDDATELYLFVDDQESVVLAFEPDVHVTDYVLVQDCLDILDLDG